MRLAELNRDFTVLAHKPPAEQSEIAIMLERFPSAPNEYLELADDATELELQYGDRYLRICNKTSSKEMTKHEIPNKPNRLRLNCQLAMPLTHDIGYLHSFHWMR